MKDVTADWYIECLELCELSQRGAYLNDKKCSPNLLILNISSE